MQNLRTVILNLTERELECAETERRVIRAIQDAVVIAQKVAVMTDQLDAERWGHESDPHSSTSLGNYNGKVN